MSNEPGSHRADGNGLTPLLQYPEMVIHPPNLYAGYTGFTIRLRSHWARFWHVTGRKMDSPDA